MVAQVRRKHPVRCSMARGAISVGLRITGCGLGIQEVLFSEFPWSQNFRRSQDSRGFVFRISVVSEFPEIWFAPLGIRVERPGKSPNGSSSY